MLQHEVDLELIKRTKILLLQYSGIDEEHSTVSTKINGRYKIKLKIQNSLDDYVTAVRLSRGPDKKRSQHWSEKASELRIQLINLVSRLTSGKKEEEIEV